MARLKVKLPAVLGIVGAEQPPRYVPVSRDPRGDEVDAVRGTGGRGRRRPRRRFRSAACIRPRPASHAEMLSGSEDEVAARIAEILAEKGLVK